MRGAVPRHPRREGRTHPEVPAASARDAALPEGKRQEKTDTAPGVSGGDPKLTAEKAIEIANEKGAFERGFYGEVVIRIKNGGVSTVDVKQTFVEAPKPAA